jgi:hypothetical protein
MSPAAASCSTSSKAAAPLVRARGSQNAIRGRKPHALYRCRRLLTKADERLDDRGRNRLRRPTQLGPTPDHQPR